MAREQVEVSEVEAREALETAKRLIPGVKARGKWADAEDRALLDKMLWTASRGRHFSYDDIAAQVDLSRAAIAQAIGRGKAAQAALEGRRTGRLA